jgi:nucleotide-binding universal stress UspA family protein
MKKIVVCVDLNQDSVDTIKSLTRKIDLRGSRIYLVHVFENQLYNADLVPFMYPLPEQHHAIEVSAIEILNKLGRDLDVPIEEFHAKCFFAFSREHKIKEYIDEIGATMVVLATRGRHGIVGLFSSSLADYLCKYSACDVFVLRPHQKNN